MNPSAISDSYMMDGSPGPHPSSVSLSSSSSVGDPSKLPSEGILRIYRIYNTGSRINFRIHKGNSKSPCIFYVNNSMFTPGTPDVQLYAGDSQNSRIVASAKFHNLSRHVTLGLGDFTAGGEDQMVYEELRKESKIAHSEYVFEMSTRGGERHKFAWRRTIGKKLSANYACIDGATGQIVAYFVSTGIKSWKKVGKLCVTVEEDEFLDRLLLVGLLSIREKESRNAWYSGGVISGSSGH